MSRVMPPDAMPNGTATTAANTIAIASPSTRANLRPASALSRMYAAQHSAASSANMTPIGSRCWPPSPRSRTPTMARPTQASSTARRDIATASPSGPSSSIVTARPSGSRSTAW